MSHQNEQFSPSEQPHDDGYKGAEVRYPVTQDDADFRTLSTLREGLDRETNIAGLARHEPVSEVPELPVSKNHEPQVRWVATTADAEAERKSEEAFRRRYPDIDFGE